MPEWLAVQSTRVAAAAFDPEQEAILVEFPDGKKWWYGGCGPEVWEEFMSPTTSKGQFIKDVLDHHPNGRYEG